MGDTAGSPHADNAESPPEDTDAEMAASEEATAEDKDKDAAEVTGGLATPHVLTVPTYVRWLLAINLLVDGVLVLGLAVRDFTLTKTASATLGSALLLAIGLVCFWAFMAVVLKQKSWLVATVLSQVFVAFLAGYIVLIDQRSPVSQLFGKAGIGLALGLFGVVWILYFGRHAKTFVTKGVAVAAALVPLLGLFQFWLETDYLPRTSRPLVDIQAELSPIGATGHTVHLLAKVTLHNRGSVQADVPAGLMRVTAYPKHLPSIAPTPTAIADGMDLSGATAGNDYRSIPSPAAAARLLYADDFVTNGSFLLPGMQIEYKKVIDVDSQSVEFARLSVSAVFITKRRVSETRTCFPPRVSTKTDPVDFVKKAAHVWPSAAGGHFLCVENQIAPQNVVHELVSDDPILRIYLIIDDPTQPKVEYPQIFAAYGTRKTIDDPSADPENAAKIDDENPSEVFRDVEAEYSPKDADLAEPRATPPPAHG
jgi:hypothetical protein